MGRAATEAFATTTDGSLYAYHETFDYLWLCPRSIAVSHTQPCDDWYIFPETMDWLYVTTHEVLPELDRTLLGADEARLC